MYLMSKLVAIKEGTKTRYVTQEVWERMQNAQKDRKTSIGDITCSEATSVTMGFTEEQFNRIFGKGKKDE